MRKRGYRRVFDHYRFECVCGEQTDVKADARTISFRCNGCNVSVFISHSLERFKP